MLRASYLKPNLVTQIVPAPHTLKVDETIKDLIADGYLGDVLSMDMTVHQGGFVDHDGPFHWRHNRDLSGFNILQMGIWYEAIMRWVGPAESVTAIGRVTVKHRNDENGNRRFIDIPDHVEILCEMGSGPLVRMRLSTVTGHSPTDGVWFFGTEGTLHLTAPDMTLYGGKRGDSGMSPIEILPAKQGGWRVEQEFVNAIRGIEPVTHTSFADGVRYMDFTEAVTRSWQAGKKIVLPL
jgi:predicted dehydrogenase